ncbi:UNVERIFIED_CONTAM: hypothetical protein GTU68_006803 [Idotea baltica]|nr:hypothetical protein [Idotea baltica]
MIDVRSDTVTLPTAAMRTAMHDAEVGDDVYKSDPTVNRLQDMCADMLGHEAALFMPTGTQSNLVALLSHCQRGDEYIVGGDAHTYKYEGGGAAVLGGIQPQTVPFAHNGEIPLDEAEAFIKPHDIHFANTKLLCLENTQHGRVQNVDYMNDARQFADKHGLILHLDGARMANAAVALNTSLEAVAKPFHTVSLCLSKGLGAPVGSLLIGDKAFIEQALRWRKVTGGGMRQAGVLAAAGILALTDGFERMHEDHENAQQLASLLANAPGVTVRDGWTQTNMVWLDYEGDHGTSLPAFAKDRGILMSAGRNAGRLVMHRDVSSDDVVSVAGVLSEYFQKSAA